jgi:hypothetical protein
MPSLLLPHNDHDLMLCTHSHHRRHPFALPRTQAAPYMLLNSGTPWPRAVYTSGSGTVLLTFLYTVAEGESSPALDYVDRYALVSNLAIYQVAGPSDIPLIVHLHLPASGAPGSLAGASAMAVDTSRPRVVSVTSALPNGEYGAGEMVPITTVFNAPVVLGAGSVKLYVNAGEANGPAACSYVSGAGTPALTWVFAVRDGDYSTDLATDSAAGSPFRGGVILRASTHPVQVNNVTHLCRCCCALTRAFDNCSSADNRRGQVVTAGIIASSNASLTCPVHAIMLRNRALAGSITGRARGRQAAQPQRDQRHPFGHGQSDRGGGGDAARRASGGWAGR